MINPDLATESSLYHPFAIIQNQKELRHPQSIRENIENFIQPMIKNPSKVNHYKEHFGSKLIRPILIYSNALLSSHIMMNNFLFFYIEVNSIRDMDSIFTLYLNSESIYLAKSEEERPGNFAEDEWIAMGNITTILTIVDYIKNDYDFLVMNKDTIRSFLEVNLAMMV